MGLVVFDAFDPVLRQEVICCHLTPGMSFKSVGDVSRLTGVRLSVVKAILKRYYDGRIPRF